jgi:hypothetical protein
LRERDGESEGVIYIERVLKIAIKWRKGVVRASEIGKEMLRERRRVGKRVRVREGGRERGRGGVRERMEYTEGG